MRHMPLVNIAAGHTCTTVAERLAVARLRPLRSRRLTPTPAEFNLLAQHTLVIRLSTPMTDRLRVERSEKEAGLTPAAQVQVLIPHRAVFPLRWDGSDPRPVPPRAATLS